MDIGLYLAGTRANLTYLDGLSKFHKQHGTNLHRLPYVDKKPLDLYRLKKAVESRGGFEKVCKHKKWAEIGRDLGYSGKIMSSLSTSLKNSYQRWLCPYEEYLRLAKPGVHQQLEQEYGGPLTPSPGQTPVRRSNVNTPISVRGDSPARNASDALQATLGGVKTEKDRDTPMADAPPLPQAPTSGGFTPVNSGFTAVNSGFTSVNRSATSEPKSFTPDPKRFESPTSSAKNTPDNRASSLKATALKRQLSGEESSDSAKKDNDLDDSEAASSRRSKRLKKGKLTQMCFISPASISVVAYTASRHWGLNAGILTAMTNLFFHWFYYSQTNIDRCRPHCGWITHDAIPSFSAKDSARRATTTRRGKLNITVEGDVADVLRNAKLVEEMIMFFYFASLATMPITQDVSTHP